MSQKAFHFQRTVTAAGGYQTFVVNAKDETEARQLLDAGKSVLADSQVDVVDLSEPELVQVDDVPHQEADWRAGVHAPEAVTQLTDQLARERGNNQAVAKALAIAENALNLAIMQLTQQYPDAALKTLQRAVAGMAGEELPPEVDNSVPPEHEELARRLDAFFDADDAHDAHRPDDNTGPDILNPGKKR